MPLDVDIIGGASKAFITLEILALSLDAFVDLLNLLVYFVRLRRY